MKSTTNSMNFLFSLFPLTLFLLVSILHLHAILNPSTEGLSIFHQAIFAAVFGTPFFTAWAMRQAGYRVHVLSLYVAQKWAPKAVAYVAYFLLVFSSILLMLSIQEEFDPRRRSTAFWLLVLSCPSVLWWHFKTQERKQDKSGITNPTLDVSRQKNDAS